MTSFVPTVSALLHGSPKAGSVGQIEALCDYARRLREDARGFGVSFRSAAGPLAGAKGQGVERLRAGIEDRLIPGALLLEQTSGESTSALGRYAEEVDQIHERADRLVAEVADALTMVGECMARIADISVAIRSPAEYRWDVAPATSLPEPELEFEFSPTAISEQRFGTMALRESLDWEWGIAALRWRAALETIESARLRWNLLIDERVEAERRLIGALSGTGIGQLITLAEGNEEARRRSIALAVSGDFLGDERGNAGELRGHPLLITLMGLGMGRDLWSAPPPAAQTAEWWANLSATEQQQLIGEAPWVIGNLPGIPFSVRDAANRAILEHYISWPDRLSSAAQEALAQIVAVLADGSGGPRVSLIALNLDGRVPFAVLGYGDLDRAENLTWEVPGMNNDAHQGLSGWHHATQNLHGEQMAVLGSAGRADESSAIALFLADDTPNIATVLSAETARGAAPRLAAELDGSSATRARNEPLPNLSMIAHSYGTPVAANALLLTAHPVQSFTMIASAGLDGDRVESFSDLRVDPDLSGAPRVYTTIARADLLAPFGSNVSGRVQPNPQVAWSSELSIGGAQEFSVEGSGSLRPTRGHSILSEDGHGYLDRGTQSLRNIAAVTVGAPHQVVGGLETTERRGLSLSERIGQSAVLGGRQ